MVEITFGVDQVVMGSAGVSYTLREWGGFWVATEPYHLGERALVFLPPVVGSGYGLSSPVNGSVGVIPLVPMGVDGPLLDVRWLASRLQRLQGQSMVGEAIALSDAVSVVSQWKTPGIEPSMRRVAGGLEVCSGGAAGADDDFGWIRCRPLGTRIGGCIDR